MRCRQCRGVRDVPGDRFAFVARPLKSRKTILKRQHVPCTRHVYLCYYHVDTIERPERRARTEAGEPIAQGPLLAADRHGAAHQLEPGPGHGAPGGGRQRLRADRRQPGRDDDDRRTRPARGLPDRRAVRRRGGGDGGVARGAAAVRAPARHRAAVPACGPARLPRLARLSSGPVAHAQHAERSNAPPGRARRHLLRRRQGERRGVHAGGQGDPGALRLAGGRGDRERARAPRGRAGAGRSRGAGRDLAGGRSGVRGRERAAGVGEPGGAPHRRGNPHAGLAARAAARGADVPPAGRAGDLARGPSAGPPARGRRPGAGRGGRDVRTGRAERTGADQPDADPFPGTMAGSSRSSSRCRTWRRSRSSSGSGRSS